MAYETGLKDNALYWQPRSRVKLSRFVLGTANLGEKYGVNRVQADDGIIDAALSHGINTFHTSFGYGEARRILLNKLKNRDHAVIVEKERIWFYPTHQELGTTKALYDTGEINDALTDPSLDSIQIPFSLFDQRALKYDWFEEAAKMNKLVFVRSIFLQGLPLMENPPDFAKDWVKSFQDDYRSTNLYDVCRGYVLIKTAEQMRRHGGQICIIFGADNRRHVEQMTTRHITEHDMFHDQ